MELEIFPFRADDLSKIVPDATADMLERAHVAEQAGWGFTGYLNDKAAGAAGIAVSAPHRAEIWAVFGDQLKAHHAKSLFQACRQLFTEVVAKAELKQVTAIINPADDKAVRFIEHLGFKPAPVTLYTWRSDG